MTLHIYAQENWHDEAYIAGTLKDLQALRNAIEVALYDGLHKENLFASDGEGYTVHIVVMTEKQADAMPVPYTDEVARAKQDAMKNGPWELIKRSKESKHD